jgi:hypothetical protein
MSIHDFDFSNFNDSRDQEYDYVSKPKIEVGNNKSSPKIDDLGDSGNNANCDQCVDCKNNVAGIDPINVNFVDKVNEVNVAGFKLMDKGIKNYFSGIRIPIGKGLEEYKILPVRITGADPEALIYSDKNLIGGRLELPILAISRKSENYDPKRYTPPIKHIYRHILCNGKKSELLYRPSPFLIEYSLEIWSEHKAEAEYALYSIISKLNPVGSYFIEEPSMKMSLEVILHPKGSADESDLESDSENRAQVKRSINLTMEGWLPVPSKEVSNILAKPIAIKEGIGKNIDEVKIPGETYQAVRDSF